MKNLKQVAIIAVVFVAVQLIGLAFMHYVLGAPYENPTADDPMNAIFYILVLLGFTGLFLVLVKFDFDKLMKGIFFVSIGFIIWFVMGALIDVLIDLDVTLTFVLATVIAALSVAAIWKYPEWYVIDIIGLPMAVGIIALLGLTFSIIPVLILLTALAVYDYISVYKTKHMLTLAEGVSDMGLPLLIIVPKKLPYSYMEQKISIKQKPGEKKEREAFLVGLGDIIIPGILVTSSFWFISASDAFASDPVSLLGISGNLLVAIGTMIGAVIGLVVLMRIVVKGNPQAGLPLLNGGAIAGFFISYLLVFGFNFAYIV